MQILNALGADFESFDVLSDDEIRQGVKEFSQWPTIPQLYIDGEEAADAERWIMKQARIIHVLAPSEQALKIGYQGQQAIMKKRI